MRVAPVVPERRRVLFLAAAPLLLVLACGGADSAMPATSDAVVESDVRSRAGFAADAVGKMAVDAPAQNAGSDSAISTMLIRTGNVSVRVDSLEPAMATLHQLARALGGVVGNISISAGDYTVRSATLELRIPAARFDAAMTGVRPIGRIENSTVNAQDVGEEYVDVRARIANARRLETRLIDLLATRTGKLEDVLAVERELARVREEVERNEGRMRWLGSRVATSTIMVTVTEPAPIVGQNPGQSVIGQAFVRAWQNFVGLVAAAISSLGVVLPIGLVVWLVARGWQARRRKRTMEA